MRRFRLVFRSGSWIQRPSKQNDDGFSIAAKEGKLQITGEVDLSAKFAKLICYCVDDVSSTIRECDVHASINYVRMANVDQLSRDDETISVRLRLDLEINLIGLSPIEHSPDAHSNRPRTENRNRST